MLPSSMMPQPMGRALEFLKTCENWRANLEPGQKCSSRNSLASDSGERSGQSSEHFAFGKTPASCEYRVVEQNDALQS